MRIAVIGANGRSGSLIVEEALERGYEVTAIMRQPHQTPAQHTLIRDVFDLSASDLEGFDAVIDTFSAWTPETLPDHARHLQHLANILSGSQTRLLVVGGAGSLYTDTSHQQQLFQTPDFPDSFQPLAQAMAEGLAQLRQRDDVQWTYISPAADFDFSAPRIGDYELAGEEFTTGANGKSHISYADYAVAMIDEAAAEKPHLRQRISVRNK